jgi:hypothetical protein
LLLDNVVLDELVAPDDNYYYAIDVRLEASNLTESYLLYDETSPKGKDATANGEKIIKDAVDAVVLPQVDYVKVIWNLLPEKYVLNGGIVYIPRSSSPQQITFYDEVVGKFMTDGHVTWSVESVYGETISSTGTLTVPGNNFTGDFLVRATSNDDTSKFCEFTVLVTTMDLFRMQDVTGNGVWDTYEVRGITDGITIDHASLPDRATSRDFIVQVDPAIGSAENVEWTISGEPLFDIYTSGEKTMLTIPIDYAGDITLTATLADNPFYKITFTIAVERAPITATLGRTLSAGDIGDTADWLEIATQDNYSLIVRMNVVQDQVTFGAHYSYIGSNVQSIINEWYVALDSLSLLRTNAVTNNALERLGMGGNLSFDGISKPLGILAGNATQDISFALSAGEAHYYLLQAISNLNRLNDGIPSQTWLRTPGRYGCPTNLMDDGFIGRQNPVVNLYGVLPALWVRAEIFDPERTSQ